MIRENLSVKKILKINILPMPSFGNMYLFSYLAPVSIA